MSVDSRCHDFADAILDDEAPRPAGFAEHLGSCPSCGALAAAHRAAVRLPRAEVGPPAPVLEREVLARVQRRRAVRAAGAGVALAGVLALVVLPASRAPDADRASADLFALADGVSELTHRDPLEGDPALRRLGAVSDWLAPPRVSSLGLDSIVRPSAPRTPRGDVP